MKKTRQSKHQLNPYSDGRYYHAYYLYVAAYLYAHGLELVNVERYAPEKYVFVFRDAPEREELARQFEYGPQALIDARNLVTALEELKFQQEEADRAVEASTSL